MSQTSNITEAVSKNGQDYISIVSAGSPIDTQITLSTAQTIGLVQAVNWSLNTGDTVAKCTLEVVAAPAEVKALLSETTIKIRLAHNPLPVLWTYYLGQLKRRWAYFTKGLPTSA